jgi:O-antigen/teichoic acid export membrane protein
MPPDDHSAHAVVAAPPLPLAADGGAPLEVCAVAGAPARPALLRAGVLVGVATAVANACAYALNAVVARALGPGEFGAVGALLAVVLVGSVPALALQAVAARRTAVADPAARAALDRRLLRAGLGLGAGVAVVVSLATPLLEPFLRLEDPSAVLWLALSLWPLTVVHAVPALQQALDRFTALSGVFVLAGMLRLAGGALAVLAGGGVAAVLAGTAVGYALAAVPAVVVVLRTDGPVQPAEQDRGIVRETAAAALGLLGLVLLTNVDVLLARRYLPTRESGLYAVGAVFSKVAFWAPQAVVVLAFPRLADGRSATVLRTALLAVGGCGAALVAGAAVLGPFAVRLVFGADYSEVGRSAWVFTALGAALALSQVLVFSGIAARTSRLALLVAAAIATEVAVVTTVRHDGVVEIAGTALACAGGLCAVGLLLVGAVTRRRVTAGAAPPSGRP